VSTKHIQTAIEKARAIALELENACPASQSDTEAERVANELTHALYDAAGIAERGLSQAT
jgi:hypothetical protein